MVACKVFCLCFAHGLFHVYNNNPLVNQNAKAFKVLPVFWSSRDDNDSNWDTDKEKENFRNTADDITASYSSIFSQSSSIPSRKSNDEMKINDTEFRLVSTLEQTLPIQVFVVLITFCWVVYIGVSGGITDGSDRNLFEGTELIDEEVVNIFLNQGQETAGPSVSL